MCLEHARAGSVYAAEAADAGSGIHAVAVTGSRRILTGPCKKTADVD